MANISDVLRPMWLQGLNEVCFPTSRSFKEWLAAEDYVVTNVDSNTGRIELFSADMDVLLASVAYDVDRFGAATLETLAGISQAAEISQSRAWPLIRSYYAAFYAAHALCRIFGSTVSKLDRDEAQALRRTATASGYGLATAAIHETLYSFDVDIAGRSLVGIRRGRGPHEETWERFERLISQLQNAVLGSPGGVSNEKQSVFSFLDSIRLILNHDRSAGNWLSKVRNNINYRHDYGAWYPHGAGKHWTSVDALFRGFLSDPLTWHSSVETKIVVRFTKGCALVVALFVQTMNDLVNRNSQGKTFMSERSLAVLRKLQARNSSHARGESTAVA